MDTSTMSLDRAPSGTVVVETRTVRRPAGKVYWFFAVLVPVLLTIGVGVSRGPNIEQDLKKDVLHSLDAAGLDAVRVSVNGRIVTADVPNGVDVDRVKSIVSAVDGVSAVTAKPAYASYAEAENCANFQTKLDKATHNERIPFVGQSTRLKAEGSQMLRDVAKLLEGCPSAVVYVGGHTDSHTRYGSTISLARAKVMVKLLESFGIGGKQLEPRGYGDEFPISKYDTPAGWAHNERGSIIVRSQ